MKKSKKSGNTKIFIWGAGGHGRVLLDILKRDKKFKVVGFIDRNPALKGKIIDGVKVLGNETILKELKKKGVRGGIAGVGDNKKRCKMAGYIKKQGFFLINAIDPESVIIPSVKLGENITVWAGAIINSHAIIEDSVIVNCGTIIEHEDIIKKGAHIGPGAKLAGRVKIGEGAFVGMGATIIECRKIGKNSIVGAGAVVLDDIPDNVVVVGIPAKIIKKIK